MAMRMKKLTSLLLVGAMALSLVVCVGSTTAMASETDEEEEEAEAEEEGEADEEETEVYGDTSSEDAFVIWGWNTDFQTLIDLINENDPDLGSRLVLVNSGGSGTYQDKIDNILQDPTNELYPDIMLLEVGYVKKYVNSDYLLSLEDLGITDADTENQYSYMKDLGTNDEGDQMASFWQSTQGCLQIRADLAEEYLGTTDQEELEEMFSSWDSILDVARDVNEASDGMVKLFSGYDDLKYIFMNGARTVGWYDEDDVIQVDPAMEEYMEYSKQLYDEDLTFNTYMWDDAWSALKDGDGVNSEAAICYCGCPWYTYWSLTDTWDGNTILVDAPIQFYWGGTGIAATTECSDTDAAAEIIELCTTDADFMTSIFQANGDYVNNSEAIDNIIDNDIEGTSTFKLYDDQNIVDFFSTRGGDINVSIVTAEDQAICEDLFPAAVTAYATGQEDMDEAIESFKSSVHDMYPYLSVD